MTDRKRLVGIKEEIMNNTQTRMDLVNERNELKTQNTIIKNGYIKTVTDEIDPATKKAKYSNAQKRDFAVTELLNDDKKYNRTVKRIDRIEDESKEIEMVIANAKYDFKIEEILSRLGVTS